MSNSMDFDVCHGILGQVSRRSVTQPALTRKAEPGPTSEVALKMRGAVIHEFITYPTSVRTDFLYLKTLLRL